MESNSTPDPESLPQDCPLNIDLTLLTGLNGAQAVIETSPLDKRDGICAETDDASNVSNYMNDPIQTTKNCLQTAKSSIGQFQPSQYIILRAVKLFGQYDKVNASTVL